MCWGPDTELGMHCGCNFSLYEPIWVLLIWLGGSCSSDFFQSLWLLLYLLPLFHPRYLKLLGEKMNGDHQYRLSSHNIWLWVSVPTSICSWRKSVWWWLNNATIMSLEEYHFFKFIFAILVQPLFILVQEAWTCFFFEWDYAKVG